MATNATKTHATGFQVVLTLEANRHLGEMAEEAGLSKSKLAAFLLEELLPTVERVQTRLQITRKPTARS
jgi:hypothetical protein